MLRYMGVDNSWKLAKSDQLEDLEDILNGPTPGMVSEVELETIVTSKAPIAAEVTQSSSSIDPVQSTSSRPSFAELHSVPDLPVEAGPSTLNAATLRSRTLTNMQSWLRASPSAIPAEPPDESVPAKAGIAHYLDSVHLVSGGTVVASVVGGVAGGLVAGPLGVAGGAKGAALLVAAGAGALGAASHYYKPHAGPSSVGSADPRLVSTPGVVSEGSVEGMQNAGPSGASDTAREGSLPTSFVPERSDSDTGACQPASAEGEALDHPGILEASRVRVAATCSMLEGAAVQSMQSVRAGVSTALESLHYPPPWLAAWQRSSAKILKAEPGTATEPPLAAGDTASQVDDDISVQHSGEAIQGKPVESPMKAAPGVAPLSKFQLRELQQPEQGEGLGCL